MSTSELLSGGEGKLVERDERGGEERLFCREGGELRRGRDDVMGDLCEVRRGSEDEGIIVCRGEVWLFPVNLTGLRFGDMVWI